MAGYNYYQPQNGGVNTYNYYDPGKDYGGGVNGWGRGEFASTPIGQQYLEDNQQAAYTRWLSDNGFRDFTGQGEFARQQWGKVQSGYEAGLATNPDMTFQSYLQGMGSTLQDQYRRLTPDQRGENPQNYSPRARYIPR